MITYRVWYTFVRGGAGKQIRWDGWFLAGFIPLYIRQQTYYERLL